MPPLQPPLKKSVVELHDPTLRRILSEVLQPPDDARPVMLFIAGCNGSGKTTFFDMLCDQLGHRIDFINADILAKIVGTAPEPDKLAQQVAETMRVHYVQHGASFATETVFSDPEGAKLKFLADARARGMRVVMVYVALANWHLSRERVAFRVAEKQGHDVPTAKLQRRHEASMRNARMAAASFVDTAIILDNSTADPRRSFRPMAVVQNGETTWQASDVPAYILPLLPPGDADAIGHDATSTLT